MDTATLAVGVLVGWASAIVWPQEFNQQRLQDEFIRIIVSIVGGLIGAYLATTIGSSDPVATAIWAWAASLVLSFLASRVM